MTNKREAALVRRYNMQTRVSYMYKKLGEDQCETLMDDMESDLGPNPEIEAIRFAIASLTCLQGIKDRHARAMVFYAIRLARLPK